MKGEFPIFFGARFVGYAIVEGGVAASLASIIRVSVMKVTRALNAIKI